MTIARYLCWLDGKTKYDQDSIVFEWYKYLALRKSANKAQMYWFCLPYIDDVAEDVDIDAVRTHLVCYQGLLRVLYWSLTR